MRMLLMWAAVMTVCPVFSKTLAELPISASANTLYLNSITDRPWWNKAWTRRAPILVSSMTSEYAPKTVVDAVFDFGEEVDPASIRVITPWETEVECVCEKVKVKGEGEERRTDTLVRSNNKDDSSSLNGQECPFSGKLRLLFMTDLRPNENKPFLVYWNRRTDTPVRSASTREGTDKSVRSPLVLSVSDAEVRIQNGLLDVVFDNARKTEGLLKRLRVVASPARNELLDRATGYAWDGFTFNPGGSKGWGKAVVTCDNAFKKEVRFSRDWGDLYFAVYAEQPRVDWRYELKPGVREVRSSVSFAVGGSTANDDLLYCGTAGKVLALSAGLDENTDSIPHPKYDDLGAWVKEDWVAIRDRKVKDIAGIVFPRDAMAKLDFWAHAQASGQRFSFRSAFAGDGKTPVTGAGALIALMGDAEDFRREYRRLKDAPRVFFGAAEDVREIPVKIPDLAHDFCPDFNIGQGPGAGWLSGEPLPGTEWASNTVDHIMSLGARVLHSCSFGINGCHQLAIDRKLYESWKARLPKGVEPYHGFKDGQYTGEKMKEEIAAAHAKGLALDSWGAFLPGWHGKNEDDLKLNPEAVAVDFEMQDMIADIGMDAYCYALPLGEGPIYHSEYRKKYGREYWKWPDPTLFFKDMDFINAKCAEFYVHAKARHPDKPVIYWNSENGELRREQFMSEQAGSFDSCMVEILPHQGGFPHVKHVVKRMRALFNNEAGRTVYHHFYFYDSDFHQRVLETELPFAAGVNGFSYENLTYENLNPEYVEMIADFYRFAGYTRLGEKAARMAPVKNLAVFRDHVAYRDDIANRRTDKPLPYHAQQDGRVRAFGRIPNYAWDVVINRYFTAKDLAPYKAVYIPEDRVFSDALAKELLAYVKAGGGAVVEGATGMKSKSKVEVEERRTDTLVRSEKESDNSTLRLGLGTSTLTLKNGEVLSYGKGKIVWTKEILTDKIAYEDAKAIARMKKLVADVGGVEPYAVEGGKVDTILQSGPEGMLLSVVNRANEVTTARVTFGERTLLSVQEAARTDKSVRSPMFLLDVKRGTRVPLTNDTFAVSVDPLNVSYYLIGGDAFTALPTARECAFAGARVASVFGKAQPQIKGKDDGFVPYKGVELWGERNGLRPSTRSKYAMIETTVFNTRGKHKNYDAEKFNAAIAEAKYLIVNAGPDESDIVFKEGAEALKAMLKRGGGICFNCVGTGPAAKAFLKEVGVFDPNDSAKKGVGDGHGKVFEAAKESPILAKARREMGWFNHNCNYKRVFTKWDAEKQVAPVRAALDENAAMLVTQDKVLGAGKVVFNENDSVYTDWYENTNWSENILSWFMDLHVQDHLEKVKHFNGGPGKVVEAR